MNDSEEVIWVEKTIDTIQDKPSSKKHYRSRSSSEDSDLDSDKSDSDNNSSNKKVGQRNRKSENI